MQREFLLNPGIFLLGGNRTWANTRFAPIRTTLPCSTKLLNVRRIADGSLLFNFHQTVLDCETSPESLVECYHFTDQVKISKKNQINKSNNSIQRLFLEDLVRQLNPKTKTKLELFPSDLTGTKIDENPVTIEQAAKLISEKPMEITSFILR